MNTAVYITLDEFIGCPEREDEQREELIEGELIVSPCAQVWQAAIVQRLRVRLAALEDASQHFVLASGFAEVGAKAGLYLPHGAEQVWLVYRKTRTVAVMTAATTTEVRTGEALEFHGVGVRVDSIMNR